jgi:hypothetical protein
MNAMPSSSGATDRLRGDHVLLRADTLALLVPQAQVGTLAHLAEIPRPMATRPGRFAATIEGAERVCAALSPQLRLLPTWPRGRYVVAPLLPSDAAGECDPIAWCWDDLRVLRALNATLHALPPVLCRPGLPVEHYVVLDGAPAFVTDAHRLLQFVATLSGEGRP